ncbi:MAG TPA: hypothetical protein VNQ73_11410 [Ilumatobacter sp.]|nr:hypothetical protein [Ilumatobacter sp.]
MTDHPTASRPARPDEVEPSDEMLEADRANGEPDAIVGDPLIDAPRTDDPYADDDAETAPIDPDGFPPDE